MRAGGVYVRVPSALVRVGWGNRVPALVIEEALDLVITALPPGGEGPMDAVPLTTRMERAGIMEERSDVSNFPAHDGDGDRDHCCMPTPSFATYIQSQRKQIVRRNDPVVDYCHLPESGALDEESIPT